ncbi:MAG: VanZ family protein, partial [Clostridia bacterium]|nr:VanZ family protein [Clostridia bacterium]
RGFFFTTDFLKGGFMFKKTTAVISLLCSALYAASDEFHQLFVPGRSGEFRDVCLDSAGALTGILIFILIWSVKKWTLKKQ